MIKRSQCMCACHKQSGVTHIAACCEPDEQTAQPTGSNAGVEFVLRQEVRTLTKMNEAKARSIDLLESEVSRLKKLLTDRPYRIKYIKQ